MVDCHMSRHPLCHGGVQVRTKVPLDTQLDTNCDEIGFVDWSIGVFLIVIAYNGVRGQQLMLTAGKDDNILQ
jgi:hypothetical protein